MLFPTRAALYISTRAGSATTACLNSLSNSVMVSRHDSGITVALLSQRYLKHVYKSASSHVSPRGSPANNWQSVASAGTSGFLLHPNQACMHALLYILYIQMHACMHVCSPQRSDWLYFSLTPNHLETLAKSWRVYPQIHAWCLGCGPCHACKHYTSTAALEFATGSAWVLLFHSMTFPCDLGETNICVFI